MKPVKTGASSEYITNLKQSILETFDIYGTNRLLIGSNPLHKQSTIIQQCILDTNAGK
jgi:hypothetical protein